jgi:hypothetical protein
VNQLRVLLDQFQERASRARVINPDRETTTTSTEESTMTAQLSRDMQAVGVQMASNASGSRTRSRREDNSVHRSTADSNTEINDPAMSSSNEMISTSQEQMIDLEMVERRNRQWEELRRRLASRMTRRE